MAIALLMGLGLTLVFGDESLRQHLLQFWGVALGLPFAVWFASISIRCLVHVGVVSAADGWDRAREEDWLGRLRRGRRSQQILAVSLYTALREASDRSGVAQNQALMADKCALKTQALRGLPDQVCRHSRLSFDPELDSDPLDADALLIEAYRRVLTDLSRVLRTLPNELPLALVLESGSTRKLAEWRKVWSELGLRQTVAPLERQGLDAIDHWLDAHNDDPSLLLVVAAQMAPSPPDNTAEVAVGLLFGNQRTQTVLRPMTYLHRPEQERGATADALQLAVRQALGWVPIGAEALGDVWLTGVDALRHGDITQVLLELSSPLKRGQGLHDLQPSLGDPGSAAPWIAIAAATESARSGGRPQLIFSGDGVVEAGLWCSVVRPTLILESE
ncbi:hypothetical protein [Metapseudomonas boanensis]|uniref:hypothetical protein n=1 Tax=Metapseudomonas boanensis TaxID=2822138 RepID=UPI00203EBCA3|nr:hypothetical protein [Pseudomonas boanensis]